MDFGSALQHLRIGAKIKRRGWNGKGYFLFLVAGSEFDVNRPPLLGIFPQGTRVTYHPHIDVHNPDGSIGVWTPNQTDVLADDWEFHGDYGNEDDIDEPSFTDDVVSVTDSLRAQPDGGFISENFSDHSDHGGTPHDDNEADLIARARREEEEDRIAAINNFNKTL